MKHHYFLLVLIVNISCNDSISNTPEDFNFCTKNILVSTKNGITKSYFENSINIKSVGYYKNGIQVDYWKYFYRNGNIKSEGHYNNGQKEGVWKEYYKNGSIKTEGYIKQCKPKGNWKFYDQKNNLIKEKDY